MKDESDVQIDMKYSGTILRKILIMPVVSSLRKYSVPTGTIYYINL